MLIAGLPSVSEKIALVLGFSGAAEILRIVGIDERGRRCPSFGRLTSNIV